MADPRGETGVGAHRGEHSAHHRTPMSRMGDEVFVAQIDDVEFIAPGQRVLCRQGGDEAVATQREAPDAGIRHRGPHQPDIDFAGAQGVQLRGGQHLTADADLQMRQRIAHGAHQSWQHRVRRRSHAADGEVALHAVGHPARLLPGVVYRIQDRGHSLQIRSAGSRQVHPAGTPGQQVDPEFTLQLSDLLGQRWLGDVQPFRGPAEVQLLGDRLEIPQVSQLHD